MMKLNLVDKIRIFRRVLSSEDDAVAEAFGINGGESYEITEEEALEIPAVASAVNFVSGIVASLPIKLYECNEKKQEAIEITDDNRTFLLNDESGDTLNCYEIRKAVIRDMLLGGAGYIFVEKSGNNCKSLRYVKRNNVSAQMSGDPVFKTATMSVNGKSYKPWEFIIVTRQSSDGVKGKGIVDENKLLLSAVYNLLKLEHSMTKSGGNKKGFLKSESKLDKEALEALKAAWTKLYSNNNNGMMVLNSGIDFKESSATAVELQLNQNMLTNTNQLGMLFGVSPEVLSGKADSAAYINTVKTAVIPVVNALQTAINRALLLENEKKSRYFVIDTSEILRADIKSRYEAYRIGLEGHFLQTDEIRYKEDLPPLGFNYIKLGLSDVLYNPTTKKIYTPNTNQFADMGESTDAENSAEKRKKSDFIQNPKTGKMMGSKSTEGSSGGNVGNSGESDENKLDNADNNAISISSIAVT